MGITAGIGSVLSGAASAGNLAYQIVKDQSLTGAEQEANAFNAEQAELNRKFQSSEAEIARQWQEDQYLKYNSPAAQIQQYKDAGLNASLMYGSSTGMGASTSTSVPAGSSASSVSPKGGDVAGALSMFGALEKLMAEVDNVKADTSKKISETKGQDIENEYSPELFRNQLANGWINYDNTLAGIHLISQQIDNLVKSGELIEAQTRDTQAATAIKALELSVMELGKNKTRKEIELLDADLVHRTWENYFRQQMGYSPDEPLWNAVTSFAGSVTMKASEGLQSAYNTVKNWFKKYDKK